MSLPLFPHPSHENFNPIQPWHRSITMLQSDDMIEINSLWVFVACLG